MKFEVFVLTELPGDETCVFEEDIRNLHNNAVSIIRSVDNYYALIFKANTLQANEATPATLKQPLRDVIA